MMNKINRPVTPEGLEGFKNFKEEIVKLERGRWTRYRFIAIHPTNPDYMVVLNLTTKHPEDVYIPNIMFDNYCWVLSPHQEELYQYCIQWHEEQIKFWKEQLENLKQKFID